MNRLIDVDKIQEKLHCVTIPELKRKHDYGMNYLKFRTLIVSIAKVFGKSVIINIAGKIVNPLELKPEELLATLCSCEEQYQHVIITFNVGLIHSNVCTFGKHFINIIFCYDEEMADWVKTMVSDNAFKQTYIEDVALATLICEETGTDINPYSFDCIIRMYKEMTEA